jgi:hypothetical protein
LKFLYQGYGLEHFGLDPNDDDLRESPAQKLSTIDLANLYIPDDVLLNSLHPELFCMITKQQY